MIQDPPHPEPENATPPHPGGGASPHPPYTPIACGTHDLLEAMAIRGREGSFRWEPFEGGSVTWMSRIRDIQVRDGAEYLILWIGGEIRLDRLREVDGVPLDGVTPPRAGEVGPGCG